MGEDSEEIVQASDYMYGIIKRIVEEAGARAPCSEGERKGSMIVKEELEKTCDEVRVEKFSCYPKAFLGWIRFDVAFILVAYLTFLLSDLSRAAAIATSATGFALVVLAVLFFYKQFFKYEEWTPKFIPYKKRESQNVVGIIKPRGEVRKRVVVSGHVDSAFRFNLINYTGGCYALFFGLGIFALVEGALIFGSRLLFGLVGAPVPTWLVVLLDVVVNGTPAVMCLLILLAAGDPDLLFGIFRNLERRSKLIILAYVAYGVIVNFFLAPVVYGAGNLLLSRTALLFLALNVPTLVALWFFASDEATFGVVDNLSACAPAMAVARVLKLWKETKPEMFPQHTEVVVCIVGCEEVGLRGSESFARAHAEEYNQIDTTVVNMESISDTSVVRIYTEERTTSTKLSPRVYELLKEVAKELGIPYEVSHMPAVAGGTDAAGFVRGGLHASSLCGLRYRDYLQYYHSDRDCLDILNAERLPWSHYGADWRDYNVRGAMEQALCICLGYIIKKDAQ